MPRKRKSINDKVTSWWREPRKAKKRAPARKKGTDAEVLLAELQEEQGRLSAELEKAFLAYDKKTRILAKQLAKWTESGAESKELERLRKDQEDLWRIVRRTQAAARTTRQLETELREWADHGETAARRTHPDHPKTRAEIVSSELRLRGRDPSGLMGERTDESFEGSARDVDPFAEVLEAAMEEPEEIPAGGGCAFGAEVVPEVKTVPVIEGVEWHSDADGHLIREIEHCCREIRRTNAHVDCDMLVGEIVMMLKDLRRLHAQLRDHDRKAGIRRYRFAIGDPLIR